MAQLVRAHTDLEEGPESGSQQPWAAAYNHLQVQTRRMWTSTAPVLTHTPSLRHTNN